MTDERFLGVVAATPLVSIDLIGDELMNSPQVHENTKAYFRPAEAFRTPVCQ